MNLNPLLTLSLYLIVQFCLSYCVVGSCASLSQLKYLHNDPPHAHPPVGNGNNNIIGHDFPARRTTTTITEADGIPNKKQIPTLNLHLEETFGHDPFLYGWFSSTTLRPNYQVEMMIRELFRQSGSLLNNEILEVFLAGMYAAPSPPNIFYPAPAAAMSELLDQQQEQEEQVPMIKALPSPPSFARVDEGPLFEQDLNAEVQGKLEIGDTLDRWCKILQDLENSERAGQVLDQSSTSTDFSIISTTTDFPPWDDNEVPDGCYFYTGDVTYKNYLICNDSAMKVIPRLPDELDIFEMNTTSVECIGAKSFSNVRVQFVKLNQNKISGVATNGFKDVVGLKQLFLNQNKLRAPIWFTSYKGLEELELLELDRNEIDMDRLRDLFDGALYEELEEEQSKGPYLTSLKYLSMKHNPIGFIPDWFFQRFNGTSWLLLTILLSGCNLYHIEENAFSHFSRIFLLELNENPNLMPNLTIAARGLARANLQKLALQHNGLTSIPKEALEIMEGSLTGLDIRGNTLIRLEDESFPEMSRLTALNMENCQISSISANAFNRLTKLDTLSLKGNVLTRVPPAIGALINLNTLILTDNNDEKVNQFAIPPGAFENLGKLRSLFMNDLKIRSINSTIFEGLVKLNLLHMTNSRLERIEDGSFIHLKNLEYLDMKGNPLASINSNTFLGLENLNSLYLPDCGLTFPANRVEGVGVRTKWVPSTSYRGPGNSTAKVHFAEVIESDGYNGGPNRIAENPTIDFVTTGGLLSKLFDDEPYGDESSLSAPFAHLRRLSYLILSGNRISEIYPTLFANLTYLHYLDLGNNRIQSWHEPIFENHTTLQNLYLPSNQLFTVSDAMLTDFKTIYNNMDLAENPFHCDLGICNLKAAVTNGSFRVHEWAVTSRHQCQMSSPPVKKSIESLSEGYCRELGGDPTVFPSTESPPGETETSGDVDPNTDPPTTSFPVQPPTTESPPLEPLPTPEPTGEPRENPPPGSGGVSFTNIATICGVLLLVLLCTSLVAYKKRQHLQYMWFDVKTLFKGKYSGSRSGSRLIPNSGRESNASVSGFDYDVFISYSHHDSEFIQDHLVPILEGNGKFLMSDDKTTVINEAVNKIAETHHLANQQLQQQQQQYSAASTPILTPIISNSSSSTSLESLTSTGSHSSNNTYTAGLDMGFKVCLHERDFEVGTSITENIIECVDHSKKVVIVISRKYLESQWCLFEMNLAYHRLVEIRRKSFVLILLEEVPAELRTKVLNYLMKSTTYLQWPGHSCSAQEKKLFWTRLRQALKSSVQLSSVSSGSSSSHNQEQQQQQQYRRLSKHKIRI